MSRKRLLRAQLVATVILTLGVVAASAQEAGSIRLLESSTENHYPDGLTFNIKVEADQPIQQIYLLYKTQGDFGFTRQPLEFDPALSVTASFTWDTSQLNVPPSTPVTFSWDIRDDAGQKLTTPEQWVYYDDLRFDWQEISDSDLIVRWYEGSPAFGDLLYETARRSLSDMKRQTGKDVDFPIFVLAYANEEDFESWHFYVADWVGGQAFPAMGITAQIIPSYTDVGWIEDVIPHEIAHLFFFQVMDSPIANYPAWLNEGLAQYYEYNDPSATLAHVESMARSDSLIPLIALTGGFGQDPVQVRLSYDQSLSVVIFLLETWGDEGLQSLLEVLRTGKTSREAVETAFDLTWEEFEAAWITWMGVPATPASSPTPSPTFAFPKISGSFYTPTPFIKPTATETPQTVTPIPEETQEASIPVAHPDQISPGLLATIIVAVLLLGILWWIVYRRSRTDQG